MFCRIGTVCPISPCLGPTRLDQSGPNPLARLSTDKVKKGVQEPGLEGRRAGARTLLAIGWGAISEIIGICRAISEIIRYLPGEPIHARGRGAPRRLRDP